MENLEKNAPVELQDEEMENVDGGFSLIFNNRLNCPFCGPRLSLLGGKDQKDADKVCPVCGNKISGEQVTDLRYYKESEGPKTTIL